MIRWVCPNGCPGVLGPERPRRDSVTRYCLPCSAKAYVLVRREPAAIVKAKAKKAAREVEIRAANAAERELRRDVERRVKAQREEEVRERCAQAKLESDRENAIDYQVTIHGRDCGTFSTFDDARLRRASLIQMKVKPNEVTLSGLYRGRLFYASFHGKKHVGWEDDLGRRSARRTLDRITSSDIWNVKWKCACGARPLRGWFCTRCTCVRCEEKQTACVCAERVAS